MTAVIGGTLFAALLGIFLLFSPLLLTFLFEDRARGLLYLTVSIVAFQLVVGLITQWFHLFTYPIVLGVNGAAALGVALTLFLKRARIRPRSKWRPTAASLAAFFFVLLAFCIIFFELFSVHYHYTGIVDTVSGQKTVVNSSYVYPTFSDEWIAVSLAQYSIQSHSLPTVNPLDADKPFPNLLTSFYTLLAELFLLLGLPPLWYFSAFAVAAGTLVCVALYAALRAFGIGRMTAAIAILCVPFITNGANLPGIWFLLAYIPSAALFFVMLSAIATAERTWREYLLAGLSASLALLMYPPMAVFVFPALAAALFFRKGKFYSGTFHTGKKILLALSALILLTAFIVLASIGGSKMAVVTAYILNAFYHANLDGGIVSYHLWNIVPIPFLPFALVGVYDLVKRKNYVVLAPSAVGAAYWIFYSFSQSVVIIEYPRVVVITSLLIVFLAGAGIRRIILWIPSGSHRALRICCRICCWAILFLSFILALSYPSLDPWSTLVLKRFSSGVQGQGVSYLEPSPPINRQLTADDLTLFKGITKKRFIAPPWKGLVIGVATGNYPLESKSSTITNDILSYDQFMTGNCLAKTDLSRQYSISYVYSLAPFSCAGFMEIGTSSEALYLYQFSAASF